MPKPHKLTLVTDMSAATVDALVASYVASFSLETFYPSTAQLKGLPDGEYWHALQLKKIAYASLSNPGHEVWCILGDREGGIEGRDVAALVIFKLPGCPPDGPTPYDAELAGLPKVAVERYHRIAKASAALTARSWPGDSFHISWLGVAPAYEKRGMAGALMRMALARAAEQGGSLRLSTQSADNVAFYEHLGFQAKGYDEWDIAGVPHTFWVMVAEPKPADGG
ncbi:hypothetical protein CcaverHIS002_0509430 [Cutaneotrichosporon cavernicola]|uniref:N-acetyltransferase domain-containing protein n=1 Tax=Cutaneotrichosporon cavernicola TaxID=279322 RepID=A0AA48L7L0_9TREE|nr:uncharacterized protein CcaverHIS019_0509990 [Cutaneotrichosporon cavernicola]BEI85542.1 hypothetical protein CcaverHIS002_0509430 [Cutaneotrichosporon cavernicola]BEI93371.1 hypothetical protein CcaverHIS019_0509990 [Cutaneotrichosporon cavernicola]BEJ01150.1 hypothetical protein CcaverHIS631_0510070 [Cutaneotrichosporon cavernicola]BEJ08918.1 hypothetical protein CcaverHIS641_0510120 [Cutaneotrichosporon cavernicola]